MSDLDRKPFDLVGTLLDYESQGVTGVLRFERGRDKKQVALSGGRLDFAESSCPLEHLVHILVGSNTIMRRDLGKVTALMRSGMTADEAVLAVKELTREELRLALLTQSTQIIASMFAWDHCQVRFFSGSELLRRTVRLDLTISHALVLAARKAASDPRLRSTLDRSGGRIMQTQVLDSPRGKLPLDSDEIAAYAKVHVPIPWSELRESISHEIGKADEVIARLLFLGLLRPEASVCWSAGGPAEDPAGSLDDLEQRIEETLLQYEVAGHYEILAVPPDAGVDQIKKAYHHLALQYHPDRFQAGEYSDRLRALVERLFTYITGAYGILGDPAARILYDESRLKKDSVMAAAIQSRATTDAEDEKIAETLYKAGRIALKNREFEKAAEHLKECVWLRPDVSRYHYHLGLAYAELPKFMKKAEQHLLKTIELDKTAVDCHFALGKLYVKVNLPRRAEFHLQETLRWDPHHRKAEALLQNLTNPEVAEPNLRGRLSRLRHG